MSKLKEKLCAVNMNDHDALHKMEQIINDSRYGYEVVDNMSVGNVVDEHYKTGTAFYIIKLDKRVNFERLDIFTLKNWLDQKEVGRKVILNNEELRQL